jgi:hypothetical protein
MNLSQQRYSWLLTINCILQSEQNYNQWYYHRLPEHYPLSHFELKNYIPETGICLYQHLKHIMFFVYKFA